MANLAMARAKQDRFAPAPALMARGRRRILVIFDEADEDLLPQLRRQFPQASFELLEEDGDCPNAAPRPSRSRQAAPVLTARQGAILELIRARLSNKEIARALAISPFTVRNHVSLLLRVLGVATREQAAMIAAELS